MGRGAPRFGPEGDRQQEDQRGTEIRTCATMSFFLTKWPTTPSTVASNTMTVKVIALHKGPDHSSNQAIPKAATSTTDPTGTSKSLVWA